MTNQNQFVAKSIILILLILLWVASGCFIFIGAYALHAGGDITHVAQSSNVFIPAIICLSVGLILFVLGLLGCFACTMDNRPMLVVFFTLILVVFMGQIAAAVCGMVFRHETAMNLENALNKELEKYAEDASLSREIDFIQSTYHCCGVRNYTDWYNSSWYKSHGAMPNSCCRGGNCTIEDGNSTTSIAINDALNSVLSKMEDTIIKSVDKMQDLIFGTYKSSSSIASFTSSTLKPEPAQTGDLYLDSCLTKLETVLKRNLGWMASLALLFAVLEVMGLIATFVVLRRSGDIQYEQFGIAVEGLNV